MNPRTVRPAGSVILLLIIFCICVACSSDGPFEIVFPPAPSPNIATPELQDATQPADNESTGTTSPSSVTPTQPPASELSGDYILSFSSTRTITDADLWNLSKDELRLARNEIYARHGRQFRDQGLQAHFNSKVWYVNTTKLPLGTEPALTDLEIANVALIIVHEERGN
jgi:hypothetical protein